MNEARSSKRAEIAFQSEALRVEVESRAVLTRSSGRHGEFLHAALVPLAVEIVDATGARERIELAGR